MKLVHPPRNICFSFRIAYTSRCQPARLAHQPLQPGNMQYIIVDDNVEVIPIYRCKGKATKPTRPRENHGLAIEHLPT